MALAQSLPAVQGDKPAIAQEGKIERIEDRIRFSDATLRLVAREIAKENRVTIIVTPEAGDFRFGGEIALRDLDQFLAMVPKILPLEVTRRNDHTIVVAMRKN